MSVCDILGKVWQLRVWDGECDKLMDNTLTPTPPSSSQHFVNFLRYRRIVSFFCNLILRSLSLSTSFLWSLLCSNIFQWFPHRKKNFLSMEIREIMILYYLQDYSPWLHLSPTRQGFGHQMLVVLQHLSWCVLTIHCHPILPLCGPSMQQN